jgi:hypothetical protein
MFSNIQPIWIFIGAMALFCVCTALLAIGAHWQDERMNNKPGSGGDRRYMIRFRYQDWSGYEKRWKCTYLAQQCENIEERHAIINSAVMSPADVSHLTRGLNKYPRFAWVFDTYRSAWDAFIHYECKKLAWMETAHNWKQGPVVVELIEERRYYRWFTGWYVLHSVEMS